MAKKAPFTFESNLEKIVQKIEEAPYKVLNIIGQNLVREIRPTVKKKSGKLSKSLGYWARKQEKDIQIGFYNNMHPSHKTAAFYSNMVYGTSNDPMKPVIVKNAELIKDMLGVAMNEIGKK